jgi:hypothetical protein
MPSILLVSSSSSDEIACQIQFLPGQWVDTFIPGVAQAGGFTITSSPSEARPSSHSSAFVELAVQATRNPASQWLWRPEKEILNTQLVVRVGGSFTWPPDGLDAGDIERLVLVAGGVGIKCDASFHAYCSLLRSDMVSLQPSHLNIFSSYSKLSATKRDTLPLWHEIRLRA